MKLGYSTPRPDQAGHVSQSSMDVDSLPRAPHEAIRDSAERLISPDSGQVAALHREKCEAISHARKELEIERGQLAGREQALLAYATVPPQPASYWQHLSQPAISSGSPTRGQSPGSTVESAIAALRRNGRQYLLHMIAALFYIIAGCAVGGIEVILLTTVLNAFFPPIVGQTPAVGAGLLGLIFIAVVMGGYAAVKRTGDAMRRLIDRAGIAALLAYLIGSGIALSMTTVQAGLAIDPGNSAVGWEDITTQVISNGLQTLIGQFGAMGLGLGIALFGVTALSFIALHSCIVRARTEIQQSAMGLSCNREAQALQMELSAITAKDAELAAHEAYLDEVEASAARDTALEIAAITGSPLAIAKSWLLQHELNGSGLGQALPAEIAAYDFAVLKARIEELERQTDPTTLKALIERMFTN